MNLVKWFRKNNTKVMAVVVIVLMIGFVGGSSLSYLLQGSGGMNRAIAHYGIKRTTLTPADRQMATQELEIFRSLQIDRVLQSQDLRGLLLGQLLFEQSSGSAAIMEVIRQGILQNQYRISDKQLSDFTERTVPTDIYWLLLRDEAEAAGFRRPLEDVGSLLDQLIPNLFEGQTYATVMQAQVRRFGVPEATIVATVGKLLAVLEYTDAVCSLEDTTIPQIRYTAAAQGQSMDIELVRIAAETFVDEDATPPQEQLQAHFDRYKDNPPGQAGEDNPFGFGYRQPARLQLDYITLKLEDVSSIINRPTPQEMETYYRQNRNERFTQQVPSDPNDPASPTIPQVRSYAEVSPLIRTQMLRDRIVTKAQQILAEARNQADADLPVSTGEDKPSIEELARAAGDYSEIAQALGSKYGLPVYSGRTGLLSPADIQQAEYLGRLALTDYGYTPVALGRMLFSVDQLGDEAVVLLSAPNAEMYRSIGPAQDPALTSATDVTGRVMTLVRIVDVEQPGPPESLDVTFSTKALSLGDDTAEDANDLYSVRERVTEDVKRLNAWDTTETRANEFAALAADEGWDSAVNTFNDLYGAKDDPNDPNVFSVDQLVGVQPISARQLSAMKMQAANNPSTAAFVESLENQRQFINRLYALVPPDANSLAQTPRVMPYRPDMTFYCLKDLSINRLSLERFRFMKGQLLSQERYTDTQELALVHFTPANILERTRFEFVEERVAPAEEDEAPPTEEAS